MKDELAIANKFSLPVGTIWNRSPSQWQNFVNSMPTVTSPYYHYDERLNALNKELAVCNAWFDDSDFPAIVFNREEDMTLFLLRWS